MQKIGKEIKIGLAVIGLLVAAFGYILFRKLTRPDDLAAAPAAATAPSAAAPVAATDKPTVVSATDVGQPPNSSADGSTASRSLFSSARRPRATEATDTGAEPRGSFMPAANSDVAANNSAPPTNVAPAAQENRFSQFGNHDSAPSAPNSAAIVPPPTDDAANNAPARHHHAVAPDGSHSLFTAANPTAPLSATAPTAIVAGGAPADPFQRNGATLGSPPERTPITSLAASQSPASMPSDPSPPQQTTLPPAAETNPLRQSADASTRPVTAASSDVVSSEAPRSAFAPSGSAPTVPPPAEPANVATAFSTIAVPPAVAVPQSAFSPAQTIPPPITPNAISVPSSQVIPPEPVVAASPVSAIAPVGNAPPAVADAAPHKPGQYIVQPNDNYWTVSEKVYGTGGYFKAIYEHNRRQHSQSDRLQVGDALDVPDEAALQQMYPELCPKSAAGSTAIQASATVAAARPQPPGMRRYVVADGDTLFEIARRELGQSSRWGEIYQLNHDQLGNNFDYLRAGTELLIPADASPSSVAREPSSTLRR